MAFENEHNKKAYWRQNLAQMTKLWVIWFAVLIFLLVQNELI
ncbi:MAG: putative membrane protein [Paraglaciecola sp.]|jgi:uncharacterized membrane protein